VQKACLYAFDKVRPRNVNLARLAAIRSTKKSPPKLRQRLLNAISAASALPQETHSVDLHPKVTH